MWTVKAQISLPIRAFPVHYQNHWILQNVWMENKGSYITLLEGGWGGAWSGGAKVSCILRHQEVQEILAHSWARPAILVAGKCIGVMFLFLLFLHFHSCSSFFLFLSFISSTVSSISFLPFSGRRHKMTHKGWRVVKPNTINQWYFVHLQDDLNLDMFEGTFSLDTAQNDQSVLFSFQLGLFSVRISSLCLADSFHKVFFFFKFLFWRDSHLQRSLNYSSSFHPCTTNILKNLDGRDFQFKSKHYTKIGKLNYLPLFEIMFSPGPAKPGYALPLQTV